MKYLANVYKGKRVLITGDSGFKGSWLAIWLRQLGADVYGYSLAPKTNRDNFLTCCLSEKIHHVDGDIRDFGKLSEFINSINPDVVFHLAAQPIVLESYSDPRYTFDTNVMGTVNVLEAVRLNKNIKAAVNVTSDKCYKNNEWLWGYRESDPMGGEDPYSASKGASEIVTWAYLRSFFQKEDCASIASARAGNVIGGGDWADFRIVPDFFRALENKSSLVVRYPEATRPWQHVLEPLGGYLLLGAKLLKEGKVYSGGWNFGPLDINNYSVRELIEKLIEKSGKGSFDAPEMTDKKHEASLLKLDISKANGLLAWSPVLDFDQTIQFVVDGYLAEEKAARDIYDSRVNQIMSYMNIGAKKGFTYLQ